MTIEEQRSQYLQILLDGGVPEVFAVMAAQHMTANEEVLNCTACEAIWGGFYWAGTPEGHGFWYGIALCLRDMEA